MIRSKSVLFRIISNTLILASTTTPGKQLKIVRKLDGNDASYIQMPPGGPSLISNQTFIKTSDGQMLILGKSGSLFFQSELVPKCYVRFEIQEMVLFTFYFSPARYADYAN